MRYGTIQHVCHSPMTGVWSFLKTLATWQEHERPGSVSMVIVADDDWPHMDELRRLRMKTDFVRLPRLPHGLALPYLVAGRVSHLVNDLLDRDGIAHYHNAWMSSALIGRKAIVPSVVTVHGLPTADYLNARSGRAMLHRFLAKRTVECGAAMVSVDEDAAQKFSGLLRTRPVHFTIVPNGVSEAPKRGCPRLQGDRRFTVGFIGSLDSNKGWEMVCEGVREVAESGQNVRLLVAGGGPPNAKRVVQSACESIGNGSAYLGWVNRPAESLIPLLDAVALLSCNEGVPMAVLECLSASVPVICTPVGGLAALLRDRRDCLFVNRNSTQFARALSSLITDVDLHASIARNARMTYEQAGSVEKMAQGYRFVYEALR